jgi:hypothetical protein
MRLATYLSSLLLFFVVTSTQAVEYLVTDTNGNVINTSNALNLGDNPVPKTIQLWMSYTDAERNLANPAGGLYMGSAIFTPDNAQVANIIPPDGSAFTNPSSQWNPFTVQFNHASNPTSVRVQFNRGSTPGQTGLQLPATSGGTGRVLLLEALISPRANINPTGTTFAINPFGSSPFRYGSPSTSFTDFAQPTTYSFTVVPEPTTYILGVVATGMLGGVGYYRRKKVAKKA